MSWPVSHQATPAQQIEHRSSGQRSCWILRAPRSVGAVGLGKRWRRRSKPVDALWWVPNLSTIAHCRPADDANDPDIEARRLWSTMPGRSIGAVDRCCGSRVRFGSAWMPPQLTIGAEPVYPKASRPSVSVERAHGKNTPLLRLPCRIEPEGLGKHAEDTRPPSPSCTFVLRKPDRDDAAKGDADLI